MSMLSKFVRGSYAKPINAIKPGAIQNPDQPFDFDAEQWAKAVAPVVGAAVGVPLIGKAIAAGGAGTAGVPGAASAGGAAGWLSKLLGGVDGGDILSALGAGVGGYMDAQTAAKAIAEQKRQFDLGLGQRQAEAATSGSQFDRNFLEDQARFGRTQGNTEAQLAVQAETALNKAPTADKAQALLLARMGVAPERFQPRDITRGVDQFRQGPSGGVGNVQAASAKAAAGYRPGQGGVDTAALKLLKQRMLASSAPATATISPAQRPTSVPRLAPPRQTLMLPATTEPNEEELLRRAPAQGIARRPMAFR